MWSPFPSPSPFGELLILSASRWTRETSAKMSFKAFELVPVIERLYNEKAKVSRFVGRAHTSCVCAGRTKASHAFLARSLNSLQVECIECADENLYVGTSDW